MFILLGFSNITSTLDTLPNSDLIVGIFYGWLSSETKLSSYQISPNLSLTKDIDPLSLNTL